MFCPDCRFKIHECMCGVPPGARAAVAVAGEIQRGERIEAKTIYLTILVGHRIFSKSISLP